MATKKTPTTKPSTEKVTTAEKKLADTPVLTLTTKSTSKPLDAILLYTCFMATNDKDIPELGSLSREDAIKIVETFAIAKPKGKSCITCCVASLLESGTMDTSRPTRGRSFTITIDTFGEKAPLCSPGNTNKKLKKPKDRLTHCFQHLKSGKCCDELIKNTLGVIFFPQHYTKQK